MDDCEVKGWREAAAAMYVPYDHELGVHPQAEGFTRYGEFDFAATGPGRYPLLLHVPYFDLYRTQVIKQADLVLAMHWRGDAFTPEQKARNFAYYEQRTVRDSSLSAATQAVLAAETGHLELAYDYAGEAALTDLRDVHGNTRDGVHIASLAGAWIALVAGLGGMRDPTGSSRSRPACRAGSPAGVLAAVARAPAARHDQPVTSHLHHPRRPPHRRRTAPPRPAGHRPGRPPSAGAHPAQPAARPAPAAPGCAPVRRRPGTRCCRMITGRFHPYCHHRVTPLPAGPS